METTRRTLLAAATAASYQRILGANDRLQLGVIGTGPRGQYLMKESARIGVDFVAVCDVYSARADQAATIAGGNVKTYKDHRELLEHKEIDAVIVATPDHWHAPITIDACRAGKDVYVEKPMVHTPKDGQALVKAARDHKRVVQVGMQARAVPHYRIAREQYVESGAMGSVGLIKTWYNGNNGYIQQPPQGMERKPDGLDWDRWLGPGPKVPWNPGIYFSPYKWLYYDGGMIMGIGIHVIDSAHMLLKLHKPTAAVAGGGIYRFPDRDTPDVINLVLEYPEKLNVTFEAEIMTAGWKTTAGLELRGTGGILTITATTAILATTINRIRRTARRRRAEAQAIPRAPNGCFGTGWIASAHATSPWPTKKRATTARWRVLWATSPIAARCVSRGTRNGIYLLRERNR